MADRSGNGKIVDLKEARKKASTKPTPPTRAGGQRGNGGNGGNGSAEAYERAVKAQKTRTGGARGGSAVKWFHYVQVAGLLLLVAWLMQTCHM